MKEKTTYQRIEQGFEDLVNLALRIFGHPFTFMIALLLVGFFLVQSVTSYAHLQDLIRDIILSITFLSLFILQKAGNKTTAALGIKINELIATHDKASNELIAIDEKTETELIELADEHKNRVSQQGTTDDKK